MSRPWRSALEAVEPDDLDGLALALVLGGDGVEGGDGGGVPDVGVGEVDDDVVGVVGVVELGVEVVAGGEEQLAGDPVDGGGGAVASSTSSRSVSVRWATRRAKRVIATRTPTTTPMARLWVATVTATVATMTVVSDLGIRRRVAGWMECQSKVPTETMIITATRAAIGMRATTSPNPTTRMSRKTPARNVEIRVRAPEAFTLIIVWPIMAQPPMPPKKPVMTLAAPWPERLARLVGVGVGDVVDELGGQQRLEDPDQGHRERVRGDDLQGVEGERHVGEEQRREAVGQLALVADVGHVERGEEGEGGERDDGDERGGDDLGDPGKPTMTAMPTAIIG